MTNCLAELERREKRLGRFSRRRRSWRRRNVRLMTRAGASPARTARRKQGRPYKRAYGEPEPKAQSNFTDPNSQIMKDLYGGVSAVLQRADGGRRGAPNLHRHGCRRAGQATRARCCQCTTR